MSLSLINQETRPLLNIEIEDNQKNNQELNINIVALSNLEECSKLMEQIRDKKLPLLTSLLKERRALDIKQTSCDNKSFKSFKISLLVAIICTPILLFAFKKPSLIFLFPISFLTYLFVLSVLVCKEKKKCTTPCSTIKDDNQAWENILKLASEIEGINYKNRDDLPSNYHSYDNIMDSKIHLERFLDKNLLDRISDIYVGHLSNGIDENLHGKEAENHLFKFMQNHKFDENPPLQTL